MSKSELVGIFVPASPSKKILGALVYKGSGVNPDTIRVAGFSRHGGYTYSAGGSSRENSYGLCLTLWCPVSETNIYMLQLLFDLGSKKVLHRESNTTTYSDIWTWPTEWIEL